MISNERMQSIAENEIDDVPEIREMAREILDYRRALSKPWAIIEPLGSKYVEDGKGAMVWAARYSGRHDIPLYRLDDDALPAGVKSSKPAKKVR
ncbi:MULTISPECIES: hypothetical protein [unclassified Pantoea]|uniref:hypothetical protein n=1 Tax=unclassified Pantoea TaxID=2630326 RepID=UPI001CD5732D|nr:MULTISPECIES: hypothetical protein [unclassified Pantoea]MCA1179356.1 hypothetical protein [Pantoea sp. alder69]MCA1252559.1 hypothetical protein [Pantoea sp. alder70]MCA1268142.1 hypothetical protein [Pantoea sp. alder81]